MSENQDRIDELMKKLELLIQQQAAFSQDVNSLKEEIRGLKSESIEAPEPEIVPEEVILPPEPESIPEPTVVPEQKVVSTEVVWPDQVDLTRIKKELGTYDEDVTKGGKQFIKFMITRHDITYDVSCAENGNWIVQSKDKDLIAKGRFMEDGKTVAVTKGENEGLMLTRSSLTACIAEAAGLNKAVPLMERELVTPELKKEAKPGTATPAPRVVEPVGPREKSGMEKFVGENLIAVIAVCIILIGVVFGVKYSIDHNLISPLTRVVLSYLLGAGILGVGIWLKKKYEMFSAILVSGSMAIMYFVTYAAYSFYGLVPQLPTFGVMVLFTAFTAYAAIHYNRQIIAHIALVGSYAVPFLLSDGSGNVKALFIYMTIVNAGILFIAMRKHWKPLYYVAFGCTWVIYLAWYANAYNSSNEHFTIGLVFGALFFLLFYATFLVYKLIKKEQFAQEDILMILLNSGVYYGTSYMILDGLATENYLGLFTVATALIHFIVSVVLYNSKLADRNLFYLSSGMVLVFLTIAIPVQLDGTWVTLLWGTEAALLFWIGRTKSVKIYEFLSYPVMAIALFSLGNDWMEAYGISFKEKKELSPFINITFLTTVIVTASFGVILYINNLKKHAASFGEANPGLLQFLKAALTVVVILLAYNMFRLELNAYWYQQYLATLIEVEPEHMFDWTNKLYNKDLLHFKDLWVMNYTMVFVLGLSWLNMKKLKSFSFGMTNIMVNMLVLFVFLTAGLYKLSVLRESYLEQPNADVYNYSSMAIGIRYISLALVVAMLYTLYKYVRESFVKYNLKVVFELVMHATIIWVLCSELINVLNLVGSQEQHKLGLSILCGLYAFVMIGIGIWRGRQYLRIAAFVLFGLTMLKVFFYDIAHLTTIAKTIVFISLGVILLVISFMYNKYKDKIQHEED